jgi:hypothetical protein
MKTVKYVIFGTSLLVITAIIAVISFNCEKPNTSSILKNTEIIREKKFKVYHYIQYHNIYILTDSIDNPVAISTN